MVFCTFDGATVPTDQITNMQMQGTYYFEMTVHCRAPTLATYSALVRKAGVTTSPGECAAVTVLENGKCSVQSYGGTCGSLVFGGPPVANCYIRRISAAEVNKSNLGLYEFTITFIQDTSLS